MLRNHKFFLFALLGLAGGAAGALAAEIVPETGREMGRLILQTSAWSGVCGGVMAAALFAASEVYHRRCGFFTRQVFRYLRGGVIGGAIAGGVAQAIYTSGMASPEIQNLILQPLCWGLMGLILGWRLASTIPNLSAGRAALAGAIGGTLGGVAFLIASALFAETIGRMVGMGALGAALGLAIVVVDSLFREASLEIVWAPKEVTTVALGSVPVTIGGGDDHIHVTGLSPKTAGVVIEQGIIQYVDFATGRRTDLRDGSKIKIGPIEIVIHANR